MMRRDLVKGAVAGLVGSKSLVDVKLNGAGVLRSLKDDLAQFATPLLARQSFGAIDTIFEVIKRFAPQQNEFININYVSMDLPYETNNFNSDDDYDCAADCDCRR